MSIFDGNFSHDLNNLKRVAKNGWYYWSERRLLNQFPFPIDATKNNNADIGARISKAYINLFNIPNPQEPNLESSGVMDLNIPQYYYVFPYLSGSYNISQSGIVVIPRNLDTIVSTASLSGCSINIYDNFDPQYRVFVHDEHNGGKIQSNIEEVRKNTAASIYIALEILKSRLANMPYSSRSLQATRDDLVKSDLRQIQNYSNLLLRPSIRIDSCDYQVKERTLGVCNRNPWIFNSANGDLDIFFFVTKEKIYRPDQNIYIHVTNGGVKTRII